MLGRSAMALTKRGREALAECGRVIQISAGNPNDYKKEDHHGCSAKDLWDKYCDRSRSDG